ncbi:MAG TPA: lysophospholipid acyltransferase family protein [Gaiellaceae bacterium]|nr:lysophospholipid acyltransferase family protein [Gaiellaceae bacterium]
MATGRRLPAYTLVGIVSYPVARLVFRTSWRGRENVPADGGAVLASSHFSNTDGWPLALGVFPRRQLRFMAKIELFRPPLGWLMRALGGFAVDRENPGREALATAVDLCRHGEIVVMFPEGTRRRKGLAKRFDPEPHSGAARIALRAQVPLIPAALAGTDRLRRLGPVRVAYGPPVAVADLAGMDRRTAATIATDRLMAAIRQLEESL